MPLVPILADIERAGVRVDRAALARQSEHLERELAGYTTRIFELAGEPFNINSPQQLGRVLFEKLQLTAGKKTGKTRAASTAADVLEELALAHELPRLVLEWRGLHKLKSTYIDALPLMVHPETGRVHTCFNQAVAATGRLSSSDPNLQNIPIRTELGPRDPPRLRRRAGPRPDLGRLLADRAARARAHGRRGGAHRGVPRRPGHSRSHGAAAVRARQRPRSASAAQPVEDGQLRRALRQDVVHAGQGHQRHARRRRSSSSTPTSPAFRASAPSSIARSRTRGAPGVVQTMAGRRRLVPNLTSRNFQMRAQAEREAVNMPIQGTAADILKRAMIDVHAALGRCPSAGQDDPHGPRRAAVRGAGRGSGRGRGRSSATRWPGPSSWTSRSTWTSGSARTGRKRSRRDTTSLKLSVSSCSSVQRRLSFAPRCPDLINPLNWKLELKLTGSVLFPALFHQLPFRLELRFGARRADPARAGARGRGRCRE